MKLSETKQLGDYMKGKLMGRSLGIIKKNENKNDLLEGMRKFT